MHDSNAPSLRTAHAERAISHARERFTVLLQDPNACIEQVLPILLAVARPEMRAFAEREFREHIQDAQFRFEVATWAYRGALELYESGELD